MTAQQLDLFAAPCLCLHGDQGEPEGHNGPCAWMCTTCDDAGTCDNCRTDRLLDDREATWNASLGRWVVTVPTLYGLLDGAPGWHYHLWGTWSDGRPRLAVTNVPPLDERCPCPSPRLARHARTPTCADCGRPVYIKPGPPADWPFQPAETAAQPPSTADAPTSTPTAAHTT